MSSPKLAVVLGATGFQGGSVVDVLLQDRSYRVRGVTRNPTSEKARVLAAKGVEVVEANLDNYESLLAAFEGAHVVFGVTNYWESLAKTLDMKKAYATEILQGCNIARAASSTPSIVHYIWSTVPSPPLRSIDGVSYVPHFESKTMVDSYIATELPDLAQKTTYLQLGFYAQNIAFFDTPQKDASSGKYIWHQPTSPKTVFPVLGHPNNVGLFVKAILDNPEKTLPMKYFQGYDETPTFEEYIQTWGRIVDKEVEVAELTVEEYVARSSMGPVLGLELALNMRSFGENSDEERVLKAWSRPGQGVAVSSADLGIEGLVGVEGALRALDWSSIQE
ncbi:NAD(P)-binding protein [Hymenopellis radicata]|nr:NAD(P)-binding protein [Hymenopellis radicata]